MMNFFPPKKLLMYLKCNLHCDLLLMVLLIVLLSISQKALIVMLLSVGWILLWPVAIVDKSPMIENEAYKVSIGMPVTSCVERKAKQMSMGCSTQSLKAFSSKKHQWLFIKLTNLHPLQQL